MHSSKKTIVEGLWNEDRLEENYSQKEKYQEHLFEQYKMYVEMTDRISSRRNSTNTFFLTLHTLIMGVSGFLFEKGPSIENKVVILVPLLAILAFCYVWWRLVKLYRQVNSAKFKVIGEFEKRLPASPYWHAEWKALGEGKDPKLYRPISEVENWVPMIFSVLYIIGAFWIIVGS